MASLKEKYTSDLVPALKEELGIENRMKVPRLSKVVLNMGFGIVDKDALAAHVTDLGALSGQRPQVVKARRSISNFKLREGMNIGAKVTLRGDRMFEFLDRLINAALPRIRDFRGVATKSFDGRGAYTLGVKEHIIFPEIDYDKADKMYGMDITIVTSARNDEQGFKLLKALKMPFRNQ